MNATHNAEEVKKGCGCIEKANAQLAAHNTRIRTELTISGDMRRMGAALCIPTEKIDKKGRKPMMLLVSYCPLCGMKQ